MFSRNGSRVPNSLPEAFSIMHVLMRFRVLTVTPLVLFMLAAFATPSPSRELPRRLYIGPYESDITLGGAAGFEAMSTASAPSV